MFTNNTESLDPKTKQEDQKSDLKQKMTDFRKDIRRQQQRDIISNRRFLNSRSYEVQPNFDMKTDHLSNNPNMTKLLPKIQEWINAPLDLNQLNEYLVAINSQDIFQQHYGIINIRKILCNNKTYLIQEIIDHNAVPRIMEMAMNDSERHLQLEATWCLANLASGTSEQTHSLIQKNVIDVFIRLAASEFSQIAEQAIWGLGNISGDCLEFRTLVLKSKAPEILLAVYQKYENNPTIITHITWVFSNLCRIKGEKESYNPTLKLILETLINTFVNQNHPDILEDCLMGFCKYVKNKYIPIFCRNDFLIKLKHYYCSLFTNWQENVVKLSAIHAIIGGVTSSEDMYTDMVIKVGFLSDLGKATNMSNDTILREICWICSNIAIGTDAQTTAFLSEPGLIDKIFEFAYSKEEELSKEAVWTICNLTKSRVIENINLLFSKGLLDLFKRYLSSEFDNKRIVLILEAIIQLIIFFANHTPEGSQNTFVSKMIETGIAEQIENLQQHPADIVYLKALHILENYFELDDEPI